MRCILCEGRACRACMGNTVPMDLVKGLGMINQPGETWRFQVSEPGADRVFLVRYGEGGMSFWMPMSPVRPGVWEASVRLDAGSYRFGYFTCEGSAFFNGGSFGLCAERVAGADPDVSVAPLPPVRVGQTLPQAERSTELWSQTPSTTAPEY